MSRPLPLSNSEAPRMGLRFAQPLFFAQMAQNTIFRN